MQYANMRGGLHNQQIWRFDGEGRYDVPALRAVDVSLGECKFMRFDTALRDLHPENKIVHFFTDDYMFDRVWRSPERYIPVLARFRAVVAPDFSLYSDHPRACQIFNHFRKHWLGAYWQAMGITVIPSPSWVLGDMTSFGWCLDGEPEGSTICVSSHGAIKGDARKRDFLEGWNEVIERLAPTRVYLFGDTFPGLDAPGLIHVENEQMALKRRYCKRG